MTSPAPAIDPTVLALLSIFGGVIVAGLIGLAGAKYQSRRDRDKWLREQRAAAYIEHLLVVDKHFANWLEVEDITADVHRSRNADIRRTEANIELFGPREVFESALDYSIAADMSREHDGAVTELEISRHQTRSDFIAAARKALK